MNKNNPGFLKLIIVYKTIMGASELTLTLLFYRYGDMNAASLATKLALALNIDIEGRFMSFIIMEAGRISDGTVFGATLVIFSFSILNLIEAVGLHMRMRWAEWMTVIGTGAMIPFELYKLVSDPSPMMVVVTVINAGIVYYLAKHRELFKSRKTAAEFFEEI